MFKPGQKVKCIDASPIKNECQDLAAPLTQDAEYTIRSIHVEPHIKGYGVRLEEIKNPIIHWQDGTAYEWSYLSERFVAS